MENQLRELRMLQVFCYECNKYYKTQLIYDGHVSKKPHLKNVQKVKDEYLKTEGLYIPYSQD